MKQTYTGGCHCGKVRFDVAADIAEVMGCNCSRCGKLGALLAFVPATDFALKSGDGATTEYRFNKHAIAHIFCATCGIQSFARGKRPVDGLDMIAVNVRCLDGVEPDQFKVKQFDGRSL
ncbi:MAG TPA: GFA family protein [Candidatus Sulfotelmatobacter sp.]|nr:GFA family protein [Candidatus Sulfotelmatobacter sp.]